MIAPHRAKEPGREHGASRTDRMPMGDRAAFDIDDIWQQSEFAGDDDRDRCEGFVDFDAI